VDIYTSDLKAVGAIFGEDPTRGPVRMAPPILAQFLNDWPGHVDDVITVGLAPPPRCPVDGFKVRFHRCQIIVAGKLEGHALRMDALALSTLAAYEAAWNAHRVQHAH